MPILLDPEAIEVYAPVIAAAAEHLEAEASAALAATSPLDQLLHVGGTLALTRLLAREVDSLVASVELSSPPSEE